LWKKPRLIPWFIAMVRSRPRIMVPASTFRQRSLNCLLDQEEFWEVIIEKKRFSENKSQVLPFSGPWSLGPKERLLEDFLTRKIGFGTRKSIFGRFLDYSLLDLKKTVSGSALANHLSIVHGFWIIEAGYWSTFWPWSLRPKKQTSGLWNRITFHVPILPQGTVSEQFFLSL
jgi:hypothetical protein